MIYEDQSEKIMIVPYFKPWITKQDKKSVLNALNNRLLTMGPNLKKFEENIRRFIGSKYAVGVSNATQALHLSVKALGIGPGDQVIVPTFTFAATANAVIYCGAEPVLVDVDYETFNISLDSIKKNITKRTRAIICVHYGGQACDMDEILSIASRYGLHIIEDCAHSLGSVYKNQKSGSMGNAGCFSFYPTKIITTGEGGMITTSDSKIYKHISLLRSQGLNLQFNDREKKRQWRYDVIELGYNYRLDEIRSSLGLSQTKRIKEINERRIRIAKKYNEQIRKIKGISIPVNRSDRNHIYHLYTIKIEEDYHLTRDELFYKLHKQNIGTSVQYYPLHLMSYNKKKYDNKIKNFSISNKLKDQVLCLPIYPTMTSKEIEYVVDQLR